MFLELDLKDRSKIAVIDDLGGVMTYGDLCDFSSEFNGIIPNRTLVFILAENKIGAVAAYVACLCNSLVPLIISADTDKEYITTLIESYRPQYIWLPSSQADDFTFKKMHQFFDFSLLETGLQGHPMHEQLSLLLSTSGSTGSPKFVRHTYQNVEANARNVAAFFEIQPSERAIAILPIQYTMGLSVVTSHLGAGATVLLSSANLTDKRFWDFMKEHKATSFTGVPFSFEILEKLRFFRMELSHLKLITQGGGKLANNLFEKLVDYASSTNKKFIATYGQTEGTARMAFLPAEEAANRIGSIGKAIPGGLLYIVDDQGNKITTPNTEGELIYEGPNVTMGYALNGNDLIKDDQNQGVLRTGDMAITDSDGYFYIVGRKSRFLKLFGVRISLDELQAMIIENFDTDCMCTGNDKQMRIYITNEDELDRIKEFVLEKTKLFHRAFELIVIDQIERNEAGKIIFNP